MTLSNQNSYVYRDGNGLTTEFPFPFRCLSETHVRLSRIYENGEVFPVPEGQYSVVLSDVGGSVTTTFPDGPLAVGQRLYIYRETPIDQLISVSNQTAYNPQVVTHVWDKLTAISQELQAVLDRAVVGPPGQDITDLLNDLLNAVLRAQAWAESPTNPDPSAPNSKSAKTWAEEAAAVAAGVQAHGALGDGATNDTAAFTAALAATTGPVFVPWTAQHYVLTALSEADRKRLWGPGKLVVAGAATRISSAPWLDNDRAILRAVNRDWQPSKWPTVNASLHNGVLGAELRRTGGFGTYGALLVNLTVPADTPLTQTDFAITGWVTKQNMSGGAGFGGWLGCNTPGRELVGHSFSAGRVTGAEINVGNRWGVGTYLAGPGNPLETTGLKIVPDVLPAEDGPAYEAVSNITIAAPGVVTKNAHGYYEGMQLRIYARGGTLPGGLTEGGQYYTVGVTTNTFQLSATRGGAPITTTGSFAAGVVVLPSYPCSFGLIIGKSIWDHRWWTGMVIPTDSIMAGGVGMRLRGGSMLAEAPNHLTISDGYYTHGAEYAGNFTNGIVITGSGQRGIRMDTATLSAPAILMGAGQKVSWGGAVLTSGDGNTLNMSTGNTSAHGILSANNTATACLRWDGNGGARLGFYGTNPQAKPSITGSRGANAALADLITKLAALGLITDSTT